MAWIETPDGKENPELAALLEECRDPQSGEVDHILAIHALHPEGLEAHLRLYRAVMAGTKSLRKRAREMIALTVSRINECHY